MSKHPARLAGVHRAAAITAIVLIAGFWSSTVLVELFGTPEQIGALKTAIALFLPLLIVSLITAGATGRRLAKGWKDPRVQAKTKRMALAAFNGMVVLVPAAVFLAFAARAGRFDLSFYAVQGVELVAGAINLVLLIANARAGMKMSRPRPA